MRNFRLFVSSPGDVAEERLWAHETLTILPQEPAWRGRISIEVVSWDNPYSPTPMYANFTPQEAVNRNLPKPSECDLVVLILWSRFGTPLTEPLRPDGSRYLSGTEWEYEDAISGEVPILLHRRISDPQVSLRDTDYAEKRRQLELVDAFFKRFTEPGGAATGGYIQYNDMSDFKDKFRRIVESAIRQSLDAEAISSSQSLDAEITTPWQPSMLAIVDRLTRQLAEKEKEIANLRQTLILRSASQSSPPVEHRPEHDSELGHPPAAQVEVLHLDSTEVQAVARDPAVEAIAPVIPIKLIAPLTELGMPAETPGIAWGVTAVGADKSPFTGNGVVVAVLDTGIDTAHPAFTGLTIIKRDFSGEGNGDWHGHGTHFAGTVFGRPVDGTRIGVAPGVNRALIAKTIGSKGGSSDALVLALNWAIEEGAEVIVLSLRFDLVTLQRQFRELDSMSERPLEAFRANVRLFDSLFLMFAFKGSDAIICFRSGGRGSAQRCAQPETGPEDAG